ncbi:MAG: hypothetical protein ACK5OC_16215, partial [Pirellula sp.]
YFPWDDHCNKRSRKAQPLLYQRSTEKTGLPKSLLVDEPWRFADSPDTACFTSNYVLEGSPINLSRMISKVTGSFKVINLPTK